MVGTFDKIDYRLRPAKHAERAMLLDLYRRLRFSPIQDYQYVGFGSVAFVDFRMVHRALGIRDMTSIEYTDDPVVQSRFVKNRPFGHVDLRFGMSSDVLPTLDFRRPSLVWLDYDQPARRSMANDIAIVAKEAPSGTFVAVTFTNDFPLDAAKAATQLGHLRDGFPEFVAADDKPIRFQGQKNYGEFVRSTFGALFETALANADAGKSDPLDRRSAKQVCFIKYRDGAHMATIGWVIVAERDLPLFDECGLPALTFYSPAAEAFRIDLPKITPMEAREMELSLPSPQTDPALDWLPTEQREIFARNYRYLPNFAPVEAL